MPEFLDLHSKTAKALRAVADAAMRRHGLRLGQDHLLAVLWERDGRTPGEVAAAVNVTTPSVTKVATWLAEAGLLTRHRDDRDNRLVRLWLTDAGRALQEPVEEERRLMEEKLTEDLTEAEREHLMKALAKIHRSAGNLLDSPAGHNDPAITWPGDGELPGARWPQRASAKPHPELRNLRTVNRATTREARYAYSAFGSPAFGAGGWRSVMIVGRGGRAIRRFGWMVGGLLNQRAHAELDNLGFPAGCYPTMPRSIFTCACLGMEIIYTDGNWVYVAARCSWSAACRNWYTAPACRSTCLLRVSSRRCMKCTRPLLWRTSTSSVSFTRGTCAVRNQTGSPAQNPNTIAASNPRAGPNFRPAASPAARPPASPIISPAITPALRSAR
jgi:DNA-binding MarR family transcriptional regulator